MTWPSWVPQHWSGLPGLAATLAFFGTRLQYLTLQNQNSPDELDEQCWKRVLREVVLLTALQFLAIQNALMHELPESLTRITALTRLDIRGSIITRLHVTRLASLRKLNALRFAGLHVQHMVGDIHGLLSSLSMVDAETQQQAVGGADSDGELESGSDDVDESGDADQDNGEEAKDLPVNCGPEDI